jgi:AcrR family transcriptional regulator
MLRTLMYPSPRKLPAFPVLSYNACTNPRRSGEGSSTLDEMDMLAINKQARKTKITRAKLVGAAYRVFVREGFGATSIEVVAKKAGYSRGAFYANFEDKEDLLFAVYQHQLTEIVKSLRERINPEASAAERVAEMRDYYIELIEDQNLLLFFIEFRLHVIRKAKALKRFDELRAAGLAELDSLLRDAFSNCMNELQMRPEKMHRIFVGLLYGLSLETLFRPEYFSRDDAKSVVMRLFTYAWRIEGCGESDASTTG